ncbi:ABC transporter permease subunit [Haloglomus litoreum]|uniref:ABC transporter permease subunit n=1 Tax=Haloglomus litoreum TaxID=3034026 RepID=UPI0023E77B2A|nr:ABC transporter permease subunit [Haloglomus sp. DT116]
MSGRLRAVVERDLRDPFRSRSVWPVLVLFVMFFGGPVALSGGGRPGAGAPGLLRQLQGVVFLFLPLATLQFGYDRVAGPRETGEIRLLLAPPHSRRAFVLGTFLGRAAFTALLVTAGYLVATVAYLGVVGVPGPVFALGGYLLALALGVSVTGLAVGLSASLSTRGRATITAAVAYLTLLAFWGAIPNAVRFVANGLQSPTGPQPEWAVAFAQAVPTEAYRNLVAALLPNTTPPTVVTAGPLAAVLVLVAWTVVPLAVGVARFERADL